MLVQVFFRAEMAPFRWPEYLAVNKKKKEIYVKLLLTVEEFLFLLKYR